MQRSPRRPVLNVFLISGHRLPFRARPGPDGAECQSGDRCALISIRYGEADAMVQAPEFRQALGSGRFWIRLPPASLGAPSRSRSVRSIPSAVRWGKHRAGCSAVPGDSRLASRCRTAGALPRDGRTQRPSQWHGRLESSRNRLRTTLPAVHLITAYADCSDRTLRALRVDERLRQPDWPSLRHQRRQSPAHGSGSFRQPVRNGGACRESMASPISGDLNAIAGRSDSDIWAVGDAGVALHWDGTRWTSTTVDASCSSWP